MARMSPTARSIFAVIDGILLFLALEGAFYAVAFLGLHASFDTPTHLYLSANLIWAIVSALAAGFTAARVAHRAAIAHGVAVAIPFVAISLFNLNKGLGGRHTPFVVSYNFLVPLAFIWGAYLAGQRRSRLQRTGAHPLSQA